MPAADRRRRSRLAQVAELLLVLLLGAVLLALVLVGLVVATSVAFVVILVLVLAGIGLVTTLLACHAATRYWGPQYAYRPAREARATWVAGADGCRLYAEVDGPDDSPLTVVFAHGVTCDLSMWYHQRRLLEGTRYRSITYDGRGHGHSDYQRLDASVEGTRQLADDLGRVIDALAPTGTLVLVGHSMGGMTVFALAHARADLMSRVGAIIAANTSPGPLDRTFTYGLPRIFAPFYRLSRRYAAASLWLGSLVPRFVLRLLGMGPYLISMRVVATYANQPRDAVRIAAQGVWNTPLRVAGDCVDAIMYHDEQIAVATLPPLPVVVIAGRNDRLITLAETHRWAPSVPHVRLTVLDECGHMAPLERPDAVNEQLLTILDETWRHLVAPKLAAAARPRPRPRPYP